MAKKGKEIIYESFEDRKSAVVVGLLCMVYFLTSYFPESGWIAKILPSWPIEVFAWIAAVTLAAQIIVWKTFRHFHKQWFKNMASLVLLVCEYSLLLFTVMFLSWPVYWIIQVMAESKS